jgi:hypothetical protein
MGKIEPTCRQCGQSLYGNICYTTEGDVIPSDEDHEHYDEKIVYVLCDGCDRKIELTPRTYWNLNEKL